MANTRVSSTGKPARRAGPKKRPVTGERFTTVTVNDVTVRVPTPSQVEIERNVAASTAALQRMRDKLLRPGIRLYPKKGVPLYWADPDRPGHYIRKLDGKIDRGIVEDDVFKVVD